MLRELRADDLDAFADMVVELYREDPGPVPMTRERARAQAERILASPQAVSAFLVCPEAEPVGYLVAARFWSNEFGGAMVYLDELWIRPAARGAGLGARAIEAAVQWARSWGAVRVSLEVNQENARARRLYERLGFTAEERVTMSRPLPLGRQLLVRGRACAARPPLGEVLRALPARLGLRVAAEPVVGPDAGVVLLAESHLSVHLEGKELFADLFSCAPFDAALAVELLREAFQPQECTWELVDRP